jgi:glycerol-3-phosphate acyltransferase PlsY
MIMPGGTALEAVGLPPAMRPVAEAPNLQSIGYLAYLQPDDSSLEISQALPQRTIGRFPIKGPLNLGGTRPSGIAVSVERGLLAVTTKPGTVHLIAIQARIAPSMDRTPSQIAVTGGASSVRR